jgi:micrococcal nuclease
MSKAKQYLLGILFSAGMLTSLYYNLHFLRKIKSSEKERTVVDVLDGDTFIFANDQRIRLLNVDAPELANCGGEEAKARLKNLVIGKFITYDESVVDKFGRLVASVYVNDDYVNEIMIKDGWGVFEGRKTAEYENLKKVSDEAKQKGLGIYNSKCFQKENLDNPKCLIKGNND